GSDPATDCECPGSRSLRATINPGLVHLPVAMDARILEKPVALRFHFGARAGMNIDVDGALGLDRSGAVSDRRVHSLALPLRLLGLDQRAVARLEMSLVAKPAPAPQPGIPGKPVLDIAWWRA